jgi:hypothetical protein
LGKQEELWEMECEGPGFRRSAQGRAWGGECRVVRMEGIGSKRCGMSIVG